MSGSVEDFDGLCGIIYLHACSDQQIRCKYEFGHEGPHSYEGTLATDWCFLGGVATHPVEKYTQTKK
jgi:hypothetical protein